MLHSVVPASRPYSVSQMILYEGLNLTFHHNDAFDSGGAIYYVYSTSRTFTASGNCFILYEKQQLPPTKWKVNVTFSENKALYGGSAMYVSEPAGYYWPNGESLFDTNRMYPFNFSRNMFYGSPALGSPPDNLTFLPPVSLTEGYYTLNITPGEELNIPIDIQDYFNSSSVVATLDTKCFNYTYYIEDVFFEDLCSPGTDFVYDGPRVFVANDTISGISLGGYENNQDLVLNFKTVEAQAIIVVLRVFFTECPYGFYFENKTKSCQCYSDNDIVKCFNFDGSMKPCIRIGNWYGKIATNTNAASPCPFDTCTCQDHCLNVEGWCKLPSKEQQLCRHNHAGPLCAFCQDGHSPNYGAYYCVPNNECNAGELVLFIFLVALFWAIVVVGLLVVLRLDMRLGSGYMYGFIYYFSILPYLAGNVIQNHTFGVFISLFTSLARLDPHFLSFFKLCFAENITPLQMELFRYINPVIVAVIIYIVILINRYCPKLSIISVHSPMHTLCILLLLSYSSLFQTSFDILTPLTYPRSRPSSHETFAQIQPDTTYFDPQHHLPYAIIALLVEFGLVIPFTLVMLLAPWLMRWGRMVRVKPILDEFQACYKDNYRWFAGYYFVARHLVALPPFFITAPSGSIFFQQNLNVIILLVHAYIQPYRERWLNLVDTVFLLDLTLITLLNGNTAQSVFISSLFQLHLALKIALMTIPCLYFAIVCTVFLGAKARRWYQSKYRIRRIPSIVPCDNPPPPPAEQTTTVYDTIPGDEQRNNTTTSVSLTPSVSEGHPLLNVSSAASDQANESTTRTQSTMPKIFNRVATRISSQIHYWRTTSYSTSRSGRNREGLPGLRGIDESFFTDEN